MSQRSGRGGGQAGWDKIPSLPEFFWTAPLSAESTLAKCNVTPSAFRSQKKGSAVSPRGATTENIPASREELGNKLNSLCYPKPIYATIIIVLLLLGVGCVNRLRTEEETTTIVIILLLFGFMIYLNSTVQKSRGRIKDMELDHSEKVGVVGGEFDFLPKMPSKKRKERKMRVKRLRVTTGEGEFRLEAAPRDGDESEA